MIVDSFDRPFRDLRISVTDRCNLRCTYCMPAEIYGERYEFLPKADIMTFEEIEVITRICVGLGAVRVRITGGEPLVRNRVETLVAKLVDIGGIEDLTMTTNGYLLRQKAQVLKDAGLDRVTVSLDALDERTFTKMSGRGLGVRRVLEGIKAAEQVGLCPIKVNVVVQRRVNHGGVVELARYFKDRGHIVRFIEYMDVGTRNGWELEHVVPAEEIVERIDADMPLEAVPGSYRGEVAERYRYKDGGGEIGVIASVTKPFCGDCTRLRLSPEGKIYTCLFASEGTDLKSPMRGGADVEELEAIIRSTWNKREDRYSERRASMTGTQTDKVEMYHIGG